MYTAEVHYKNTISTITAPTIEALHHILFALDEDIFVNGTQVKAFRGQHPDYPGAYFGGYTQDGLAALFNN